MKPAARLKLLIAGLVLMVVAVASWVALISWEGEKSDRSHIVLIVRGMYSVSFAVLFVAIYYYRQELKQHPPMRAWKLILLTIIITWAVTVKCVHVLLVEWYPGGLSSIWCVLLYAVAVLVLSEVWLPVRYHAQRYRRHRNEAISDDQALGSDENREA